MEKALSLFEQETRKLVLRKIGTKVESQKVKSRKIRHEQKCKNNKV